VREAQIRLSQLTVVISEQVERALESVDGVIYVTATRAAQADLSDAGDRARIHTYLNQQAFNLPQARSFLVLDPAGNRIVDSQYANPLPQNNSDGEGYRHFRDNPEDTGSYLSAPMKSRQTGEWYFGLSRRLDAPEGAFSGLVIASLDLSYFEGVFKSVALGKTSSISFTRTDGIHLFRYPVVESAFGRTFADGKIHKEYLPHTNSGVIREVTRLTGVERMLSFRTLKDYPVVIIVGTAMDEILAPWRLQASAIGGAGVVALLVFATVGLILLRFARREDALLAEAQEARDAAELATKVAERASRSKSEFLAGVSHDLRTPLNSIIGFSEVMLAGNAAEALSEKSREYVGFVHTAGQHLLSLINNLLDLAKIEANRMSVIDEQFSLHGVVGECLRLVDAQAKAGRVEVLPYAERELGLSADPVRMRQILFNLLSNAIKFTPAGGTVEVRSVLAEDGSLCLSVVDSGQGMSESEITTAMQPYGQVVNMQTRNKEGTGLGLPLVKALVELHGGRLDIKSTPGKGSVFTVVLPAERVILPEANSPAAIIA
jgi:signal transduction histidine kinase